MVAAVLLAFTATGTAWQPAAADPLTPANVSVDFAAEQGSLLHTERFNNFDIPSRLGASPQEIPLG
jgi:hypothetical protein